MPSRKRWSTATASVGVVDTTDTPAVTSASPLFEGIASTSVRMRLRHHHRRSNYNLASHSTKACELNQSSLVMESTQVRPDERKRKEMKGRRGIALEALLVAAGLMLLLLLLLVAAAVDALTPPSMVAAVTWMRMRY